MKEKKYGFPPHPENAVTFWDENGNPILHIVSENEKFGTSEIGLFDTEIRNVLEGLGIIVDNSSEELLKVKDLNME